MLREKLGWMTHESLSTDAEHRGGAVRSSDDIFRKLEGAKGLHRSVIFFSQPETGGANGNNKIV